jgi:hypothetical protein
MPQAAKSGNLHVLGAGLREVEGNIQLMMSRPGRATRAVCW